MFQLFTVLCAWSAVSHHKLCKWKNGNWLQNDHIPITSATPGNPQTIPYESKTFLTGGFTPRSPQNCYVCLLGDSSTRTPPNLIRLPLHAAFYLTIFLACTDYVTHQWVQFFLSLRQCHRLYHTHTFSINFWVSIWILSFLQVSHANRTLLRLRLLQLFQSEKIPSWSCATKDLHS